MRRLLARAALLASAASPAAAQEATHLAPEAWTTSAGRAVVVAPPAGWDARPVSWLAHRAAGAQTNLDTVPRPPVDGLAPGDRPPARFAPRLDAADTHVVAATFRPRRETVDREAFAAFARARLGATPALREDARSLVVERRESAQLLVVATGPEGKRRASATAQAKLGLDVELRPLADPTAVAPGSALPLRLYTPPGVPRAQRVVARHAALDEAVECRTDADGFGHLVLPRGGPWVVEAHAPAPGDVPGVDLVLHGVTLAFEAPARALPEETEGDGR